MKGKEHFQEECPICPYCDHKDTEWWDGGISESEGWGDPIEYSCCSCTKKFTVEREVIWTSRPSCELNNEECELEEIQESIKDWHECNKCHEWKAPINGCQQIIGSDEK